MDISALWYAVASPSQFSHDFCSFVPPTRPYLAFYFLTGGRLAWTWGRVSHRTSELEP